MGHSVERVARLVKKTAADAWLVESGSKDVLDWFSANQVPTFAYAGRANHVPLASIAPDKVTPLRVALQRLADLGHFRIVMLVREGRRKPEPGFFERAFLDELEKMGISTGPYNPPDWEESIEGFHACLESLFRVTPPTALIIDEVAFTVATLQFCLAHGLQVPRDVSILCSDPGPAFDWCQPSIAHIGWDYHPVVRRIVRWANNVSRGRKDLRKGYFKANFVDGGSIGPAKRG
jgi:DNA-binding LacI/PurR family transcriptional regulator